MCCDALDRLIKTLRDGPPARLDHLLEWIRASKSPHDIVDYAHRFSTFVDVVESENMSTSSGTIDRSFAGEMATETRLANYPASDGLESEDDVALAFGKTVNSDRLESVSGIQDVSWISSEGRPPRLPDNAQVRELPQRIEPLQKKENEGSAERFGPADIWHRDQELSRDQSEEFRSILPLYTLESSPWSPRPEGDPLVALSAPPKGVRSDSIGVEATVRPPIVQMFNRHTSSIPPNIFTESKVSRYLALPCVLFDSSPRSRLYTDYIHGATQMLQAGVPAADILGSHEWVPVDLLFRPRGAKDKFDCASWACEISRNQTRDIFVRLASVYLLTRMMQVSWCRSHSIP